MKVDPTIGARILLVNVNRPDFTVQQIHALRKVRPSKNFYYGRDGFVNMTMRSRSMLYA